MNILGINYFFHDSSACVVANGKLLSSVEEERLTRKKHTGAFPWKSIDSCLKLAGMEFSDIDHIALSIKPTKDWQAKTLYLLSHLAQSRPFLKHEVLGGYFKQREFWNWFNHAYGAKKKRPQLHFVPHHVSHAAGSFLVSPYEDAAILSLDGSGEWATSFLGHGTDIDVETYQQSYFPMSLGSVYEAATEFCGFQPNYDEGKTMGFASFGDPSVYFRQASEIVKVDKDGAINIDLSYFNYQFWGKQRCSPKFHEAFGAPRLKGGEYADNHRNVAAAFQKVLEECALEMCRILRTRTRARNIVLAGGVALNSVMNGRILREAGFDDIYVMPAAGDNGSCIGAAYYVQHTVLRQPRSTVHDDPYLGTQYADQELEKIIRSCKLPVSKQADIATTAAELLSKGKILGWFQGRMEIGPRALGNRSILADPSIPDMKDKVNAEVKHREAFRPFAPSAPVEDKDRYFDIKGESPFMLKVCDVRPEMRSKLPAITHVDGTARLQTVNRSVNPLYYSLIQKLGERTGIPVVLNTSFNVMGEPIVESPIDAIRCFFSTGLDYLAIGSYLIDKK